MISIIVARDNKNGVGIDNKIPWLGQWPEDMQFFKDTTIGRTVIMGNNTWYSLPLAVRPLPDRHNVVVASKIEDFHSKAHAIIAPHDTASIEDRVKLLDQRVDNEELFIIGGPTLWNSLMHIVDKIYMTRIPGDYSCNTFFNPDLGEFELESTITLNLDADLVVAVYRRKPL